MQLLWFIVISNIAVTAADVVMALQSWHLPPNQHLPASIKTPCITVMAVFLASGLFGEWLLARGVRSEAWPSASLDSSRRLIAHPAVKALPGVMLISAILYFIASPINGLNSFFLFMCLPLSLSRVSTTLQRKTPESTSSGVFGSTLGNPLQSDQWGH